MILFSWNMKFFLYILFDLDQCALKQVQGIRQLNTARMKASCSQSGSFYNFQIQTCIIFECSSPPSTSYHLSFIFILKPTHDRSFFISACTAVSTAVTSSSRGLFLDATAVTINITPPNHALKYVPQIVKSTQLRLRNTRFLAACAKLIESPCVSRL